MSVSDLVGEIEGVRRKTRRESFGGAVPLALLGLLVLLAAPFYHLVEYGLDKGSFEVDGTIVGFHVFNERVTWLDRVLRFQSGAVGGDSTPLAMYWLFAVPVTFAAIAAYYGWRARSTGLSLNGWRVAATGVGVFVALVVSMALSRPLRWTDPERLMPSQFLNPLLVVAVAVFVLAWVERSRGVLVAACGFVPLLLVADLYVYSDLMRGGTGLSWVWTWAGTTTVLAVWLLASAGVIALVRQVRRA